MSSRALTNCRVPPPRAAGGVRVIFFVILLFAWPETAAADDLSVEAGRGFHHSQHTEALFLRYQKEAPFLFGQEGFYEGTVGAWNGSNRVKTAGIGRGLRWRWGENNYFSAAFGLNLISRTTANLGTPFEFSLHFTLGRNREGYDISLGYVHYSNGKYFFGWSGPNYGENFLTVQVGWRF